ncbi:hypothetical protein BGZ68_010157 [Mortierella alpina]|nr:hypothetical protein BGZ68_010157 [Mortierella alpina]
MFSMQPTAEKDASSPQLPASPSRLLSHPAVIHLSDIFLVSDSMRIHPHTVNVFDFDQTLFRSPLPSPALWDPSFIGTLISWNDCGAGWWHTPATLDFGPEAEASAWEGWWNEDLVKDVERSSSDPGCLTILLTGRNGPVYGKQLLRMLKAKGLDFDLVATKPNTVARLNSAQDGLPNKKKEKYLKLHTFSTKHDFLYHVLFEFPSIRHMHVWDDRPGQIAKFRQAGQEWLDKKMLETFEITTVQIPHRYMDPKREMDLVTAMVQSHNRQVELEAKGGAFLVAGIGPMPEIRPELVGNGLWGPFETYVPQRRSRIELGQVVQYTGVLFSESVQSFLRSGLKGCLAQDIGIKPPPSLWRHDLSSWVVAEDMHVALCRGASHAEHLQSIGGLGATVLVEVEAAGEFEERIWALKVKEVEAFDIKDEVIIVGPRGDVFSSMESFVDECRKFPNMEKEGSGVDTDFRGHVIMQRAGTPHILMAYDRFKGMRPSESSRINHWKPLEASKRIILVGTIGQKKLLGMKPRNFGRMAVVPRAEVSIANLIKQYASSKNAILAGKQIGNTIAAVEKQMASQSVTNKAVNKQQIEAIVETVVDYMLVPSA